MSITTYQVRGFNLSPSERKNTPNDDANVMNYFLPATKRQKIAYRRFNHKISRCLYIRVFYHICQQNFFAVS
jgi:hypothetical protein